MKEVLAFKVKYKPASDSRVSRIVIVPCQNDKRIFLTCGDDALNLGKAAKFIKDKFGVTITSYFNDGETTYMIGEN